jgi:MurNAc alpha-1-phosphate uridylyltransferase
MKMDALLLLVPLARANFHGGQGDFHLDAHGRITARRKPGRLAPFVYSGVQILSPRVIADWPEGPFSTMLFWERAIAAGRARGLVHQGQWFDIGTPKAVKQVEAMLADG